MVPINTSQPLFIPLALSLFSVCLAFCMVAVAVFALSSLLPSVLCSLSLFEAVKLQDCQNEVAFLEEVIHYISNVEMTAVRQNTPWTHTLSHTHMLLCLGEQRPEPAGSHNSAEEEEYQTTGSFFC